MSQKEKHMKKTHKSQPSRFIPQTPEIKLDSSTSFTLTELGSMFTIMGKENKLTFK